MRSTKTTLLALLLAACADGPGRVASPVAPEPSPSFDANATVLANQLVFVTYEFGAGELFVANAEGGARKRLTSNQVGYNQVTLAPSGRRVASTMFLGTGTFGIFVSRTDGLGVQVLTTGHSDASPAWSPVGNQIAFQRLVSTPFGDAGRIFVMNADGSNVHQVSSDPPPGTFDAHSHPAWSPDGTRLVYCGFGGIVTMNADGSNPRTLPTPAQGCFDPEWSSTGWIAAFRNVGSDWVVFSVKSDGMDYREHLRSAAFPGSLAWAPNGGQLFLTLSVGALPQLHRISLKPGSLPQRISTSGISEFSVTAVRSITVP